MERQTIQNATVLDMDPTSPPEHAPLMARLLERPPLPARSAKLVAQRRKIESYYRPHRSDKNELSPVSFWRGLAMTGLRFFLKVSGLYKRGNKNALDIRITRRDLFFPNLPEGLDGFRILHLSDPHLSRRFPRHAETVAKLLTGIEVDLCALTGDYRYGYFGSADHVPSQLHTLLSGVKSRHGVVACMGNHDAVYVAELIEASGIPILFNEGAPLHVGGATLWISAVDDPHNYGCDRLDLALRDAPEDAFIILLAHTPERIVEAAAHGVNLYLTGHTHAGQIRLPWIGALSLNAACTREQAWGVWKHDAMLGHTSSGLGVTDLPVRYNCPPEATVITLKRQADAARQPNGAS